jgi:hypothetical protein
MNTEIFIEANRLDVSASISNLLTFAIDDIKEFGSRQTKFSKTVVLPGTDNNNRLFGNIFETGLSNDYDPLLNNIGYNFNAAKSASCVMFQDNIQTFKGTLRLLQINKDKGVIEYETALNGDLTTLATIFNGSYLSDLDFSSYDHSYNVTNIVNSWDNLGGSGYYYPLIDYGNYSALKQDWNFKTFRPALYVKEYIDKMFNKANFRYDCALFNTTRFKNLIIPHNQKTLRTLTNQILNASISSNTTVLDAGTPTSVALQYPTFTGSTFIASNSNSRFTFNSAANATLNIDVNIFGTYLSNNESYKIDVKVNGTVVSGQTYILPYYADNVTRNYSHNFIFTYTFLPNDYIEIVASKIVSGVGSNFLKVNFSNFKITSLIELYADVFYNQFYKVNDAIPINIKQKDFFTSIIQLFNLYVYEDKFDERLIKITPYIDFYSTDSGNADDWTYKLNRNEVIKIKPLSELNSKTYKFNYKDDSDFYNELYKKRYNQGYGSLIFNTEFEYATNESTIELIFSPTPLVGYQGIDKVYSTIFKKNANVEENTDCNIRILQTKKITSVSSWKILDGATTLSTLTNYGYAGHLDDPDAPTNDLNFGALKQLFFTLVTGGLNANQFNVYWSSYMAEITDKDSKTLTAKFYLTPKDIFDLDFSKYKNVDGDLYRLNKIVDYNSSTPDHCEVTLLKVINTIY